MGLLKPPVILGIGIEMYSRVQQIPGAPPPIATPNPQTSAPQTLALM